MATEGKITKADGRNPSGTSYWEYPKSSGVKIKEIINRSRGEDFGASYQVVVPARITGYRRIRRQFPTLAEAKRFTDQELEGKEEYGTRYFDLTGSQRIEALRAFNMLPPGDSLVDAVSFYLSHHHKENLRLSLAEAVDEFISEQETLNLRPRSMDDLRYRLGVFVDAFDGRNVSDIRTEDLRQWLSGQSRLSPRSLKNFRNTVCRFFNWTVNKDKPYRIDNPAEKVPVPKIDWKPPVILTVSEMKRLFSFAMDNESDRELIPFLALAAFAGLRTAEISRLSWKSIDLRRKLVTIGADQAKKRRLRGIDLSENAAKWLRLSDCKEGAITPGNLYSRLADLRERAKFTNWKGEKSNALRHSFGSYHYALYDDAALTAGKLGHKANDDQLFDHYRSLVEKKEAEAYFSITPENVVL